MHLTHLTLTTLSIPLDARHMAEWPVPRSDDSAVSILSISSEHVIWDLFAAA